MFNKIRQSAKNALSNAKFLLLGLTTSGATFALEAGDVTGIGTALTGALTSIFGIIVQLAPYLAAIAGIWFIYKMVAKKLNARKK